MELYDCGCFQHSLKTELRQISPLIISILPGKLYAVGGRDGTSCLATAECYDPETGVWTAINPMTMKRGGVAVAVIGDLLYAVGG